MIELFVTGTDTGAGKTTVSCALLAAARARGMRTRAMKPIETGCEADLAADAAALEIAATGGADTLSSLSVVYRFAAPLAPAVAAEYEGRAIELAPILQAAARMRALAPDLFLVEGAGGLLVPITDSLDMADLAAALGLPLLVVARDGLGTINHTLLTLEAAASRGRPVRAVILTATAPGTSERDAARNALEIERRGRVPVLGRLPHLDDTSLESLAAAAEAHLDLRLLG